jgi:hypothetical protein
MVRHWIRPVGTFHRDQKGQAIFLGLFYFLLLAALAMLVLNSGQKANRKIGLQNAADAVAGSAASWYARGLNTIAMCNVTQTQLFSMIIHLDTLEEVAPAAQWIIDDLLANIGSSAHGSDVVSDPLLKDWLIVTNARAEQQMIRKFNDLVRDLSPLSRYCNYDDGTLWQCTYVLNEMKTQMAGIVPEMAQKEAMTIADKNDVEAGFVVPFYPELPIEPIDNSGHSFSRFRNPMVDGRRVNNRRKRVAGYYYLQYYGRHHSWWHGNLRNVRGPFKYMREPLTEPVPMGLLELSRFSVLFRIVSDKKLAMFFGGPTEKACLLPENRIEDYDKLVQHVSDNGRDSVIRTYWTRLNFSSRYEYDTPMFRNRIDLRHHKYPRERLRIFKGYRAAPNGFKRATTPSEGADPRHDLWYRSRESRRAIFPQLEIYPPHPPYYPDGSRWPYTDAEKTTFYRNSLWRFDGADVGEDKDLNRDYLPPVGNPPDMAPIVLDSNDGSKTTENIHDRFSFVGFASDEGQSPMWPTVFRNPVPTDDKMICYAQTQVFNDTGSSGYQSNDNGWDLFTQNWRYRLVRTENWQWALDHVTAGIPGEATYARANLDESHILTVRKMLEMYTPEMVNLITH